MLFRSLGHSPTQYILAAPFLAIAEAKNDNVHTGLGQCIAAMVAARIANERAAVKQRAVHGIVSTGVQWKFLLLRDDLLTIDRSEYSVANLPRLMGVLRRIVDADPG